MTVYQVGEVVPPTLAPTPETAGGYKLLGCAEDDQAARVSVSSRQDWPIQDGKSTSSRKGVVQR